MLPFHALSALSLSVLEIPQLRGTQELQERILRGAKGDISCSRSLTDNQGRFSGSSIGYAVPIRISGFEPRLLRRSRVTIAGSGMIQQSCRRLGLGR
jgi:hypothetical protein